MNLLKSDSVKYKLLTFDELVINLDRLSRFKLPENTYYRVFCDIFSKYMINPKYSKEDIAKLDFKYISKMVKEIWNNSVKECCECKTDNGIAINVLQKTIKNTFCNIDENINILIGTKLNISPVLKLLEYEKSPLNLKYLIMADKTYSDLPSNDDLIALREKYSLCFPVKKLLIAEGITEEILLPVFAAKMGKNFNNNGIYILGAGGKSKSPSLYMKLKDRLKIPIILLFDSDAKEICLALEKQMNKKDKCIIIQNGEFEDILSDNLIKRTLNKEYEPATLMSSADLKKHKKMCDNIEDFYRTRHLGEYKKSKVAKLLAENIKYETDISEEIKNILNEIL